jgi:hypothetical protein
MATIEVSCAPLAGGHRCEVTVRDGGGSTDHVVTVAGDHVEADPERLVRETFVFLLEREPKESILQTFDISVVSRYFPEYDTEIWRRLNGR